MGDQYRINTIGAYTHQIGDGLLPMPRSNPIGAGSRIKQTIAGGALAVSVVLGATGASPVGSGTLASGVPAGRPMSSNSAVVHSSRVNSAHEPDSNSESTTNVTASVTAAFNRVRNNWQLDWPTASSISSELVTDDDGDSVLRIWLIMDEAPTFSNDNIRILHKIDDAIYAQLADMGIGAGLAVDVCPIIRHSAREDSAS
jgi:hypothetical protein